jgi:hypothetical protein
MGGCLDDGAVKNPAGEQRMNPLLLVLPVSLLGAVLLAAGCTSTSTAPVGESGTVLTCIADGDACDTDDDCCNLACAAGLCAATQNCGLDGDACSADGDCCSGVCAVDGSCGFPANVVQIQCVGDGDACLDSGDCCNNLCDAKGTCDSSQTCTLDNYECGADAECCTNICGADGFCGG